MLHSLSKILHFTPLSEKPHKLGLKRQMKKKTYTKKYNIYEIKSKNDWGQSSNTFTMSLLVWTRLTNQLI